MIFVDVDDTLVLYRDDIPVQQYGVLMGLGFRVNHLLVDRILQYRSPNERVVVWSSGGAEYARAVVEQYCPRLDRTGFYLKDETTTGLISPGDIAVDDDAGIRDRARAMGARGLGPLEQWIQGTGNP